MKVKSINKTEIERKKIIDAAIDCFIEKGYSNVSVNDIVKKYGKSKGNIYYYFKSKEEIFYEIFDKQSNIYIEMLNDLIKKKLNFEDFIIGFIDLLINFLNNSSDFLILILESWAISYHNKEVLMCQKHKKEEIKKYFKYYKNVFNTDKKLEDFITFMFIIIDGLIVQKVLNKLKITKKLKNKIIKQLLFYLKEVKK